MFTGFLDSDNFIQTEDDETYINATEIKVNSVLRKSSNVWYT